MSEKKYKLRNGEWIKFSLQATLSEIFKGLKPEGGKFYKNIYYVFINNPVWKYIREASVVGVANL